MTRAPERPLMRKRGPASGLVEIKSYGKEAARRLDNDDRMVLFLTLARSKGACARNAQVCKTLRLARIAAPRAENGPWCGDAGPPSDP